MKHKHDGSLHFDAMDASHELLDEPHEKYGGYVVVVFWALILAAGMSVIIVAGSYFN